MKALKFIFQYLKDWKNWLSHTIVGILILLFAFYFPVKPLYRVIILIIVITLNTLRMRNSKKRKISK